MFQRVVLCLAVLGLTVALAAAAPEPIPQELAARIGKMLAEEAGKLPEPIFKIDADGDKATGLHDPGMHGLLVVPCKDLTPKTLKGVDEPNGAPAGFLFLYKLTPLLDGKKLASDQLPVINHKDDNGNERQIVALRLALKKESEDKWKLLVFGKDKKPLLASTFREEANNSELPLSVSAKDVQDNEGTLVVTAFGKYAADIRLTKAE